MSEKTTKINMYGKHICSINESFIKKLREDLNVTNYSSWIRYQAYEEFNLHITNSNDIEKLKEIVSIHLYDNIGDWVRDKIRVAIKNEKNPFIKDTAIKILTDNTILKYSITHTIKKTTIFEENKKIILTILKKDNKFKEYTEETMENFILNIMTYLLSININCSYMNLNHVINKNHIIENILILEIKDKIYFLPLSNKYIRKNRQLIAANDMTNIHRLQYLYGTYIGDAAHIGLPNPLTFENSKQLITQLNSILNY